MDAERHIKPLHHVTCSYPLGTNHGSAVRVLITEDGISQVLLDWFLAPRNRRKSESWQRGYAQAFGLFYDFVRQNEHLYTGAGRKHEILSDFAEALLCGTIQPDGSDISGLFWPKVSFNVADAHVKRLTTLSDYCVEVYGTDHLNPWTTADWAKRLAQFRTWDLKNKRSLMKHVGDRQAAWERAEQVRDFELRRRPRIDDLRPPTFHLKSSPSLYRAGLQYPAGVRRAQCIDTFTCGT